MRKTGISVLAAAALLSAQPLAASGGGASFDQIGAAHGIALPRSPYRWQAISPRGGEVTLVARVDRRGGEVSRWWSLRGRWDLSAAAYDRRGVGLAGDESVLVLTHFAWKAVTPRRQTRLAILETGPHPPPGPDPVTRVTLPGDYSVYALSDDGSTLFLVHFLSASISGLRYTIEPYDLRTHRLLSAAAIRGNGEILDGTAIARAADVSGPWTLTLYVDAGGRIYVLALDTLHRTLRRIELPQLRHWRNPFLLRPVVDASGHHLTISSPAPLNRNERRVVARIDLRKLISPPRPAPAPVGVFGRVIGHSLRGRPIELLEVGDLSLPGRLLVFGCIHGDECGASALEPLQNGCPDPDVHVYVIPNLDPDGSAVKSRLNAHGVDLNRNFPAGWRPIGERGDLEYAGPRPFSEPEARLAARLIRRIGPQVTIWFHQDWGGAAYVRAWGQSVPAARRFASFAGIGFRLLHWPAGTAPNWQNHRFPGTASFVVETPRGKLGPALRKRLTVALSRLGEEVGEDPGVPRKG